MVLTHELKSHQYTEVHFAGFLSGGFITAIVVNPPERKLAKRTSVQCSDEVCKNEGFNVFLDKL